MVRETRSDKMYRELNEFLENEKINITSFVLFKSEAEKLQKHLKEKNIAVQVTVTTIVNSRKVRVTLEKM